MKSELARILLGCRNAFIAVALLSGGANIFALTGAIFMLTVYDRVIPSGSVPSLIALGLMGLTAYGIQGFVEIFRSRILTRVGLVIKEALSSRSYDAIVRNAARGNYRASNLVRDLDTVQGFLSSLGPATLFDLPWLPIFLAICYSFHPFIGATVTAGALVLVSLAVLSNALSRSPSENLNESQTQRASLLAATQAHAETIQAMGMNMAMAEQWANVDRNIISDNLKLADLTSLLGSISRVLRMVLQSFVLAVGAFLVIQHEATGGIMIASSILSARALSPIDQSIAQWKNIVAFRQSWRRLDELYRNNPAEPDQFSVPLPHRVLTCERIAVAYPNSRNFVLRDVSFAVKAGEALGVVGPTGSGKSSLVRTIVGLWRPEMGAVRLDGQPITRWNSQLRGRIVGYLPQSVALFSGTIAENIARFDPDARPEDIVNAAKTAGVHELISHFPEGYDSLISESGGGLSGGQSQRVALARALFGDPFLVVLDEPNSNLDTEGEAALQLAIQSVKQRGGIVVIVAHRPSVLSTVDHILVLADGRVRNFGARDEVMQRLGQRSPQGRVPQARSAT